MTDIRDISFAELDIETLADVEGRVAVLVAEDGKLSPGARRVNRLTKGAVARAVESDAWGKLKEGGMMSLAWPVGMAAQSVDLVRLSKRPAAADARKAGVTMAKAAGAKAVTVIAGSTGRIEEVALGLALRGYDFADHKSDKGEDLSGATFLVAKPDEAGAAYEPLAAIASGVFLTRDLVNEPSNILTTTEFAKRLTDLKALGLKVEVLEEADLEKLGMRTLLAVGQGSDSPSKVVAMQWNGGKKGDAPLALIGKGVVFDTGGISLKPAGGMEDMTMDMGGAGVVAGTMMALAKRKAKANVVGLVGLVENMPSGGAMRPGDVVKSMKGDTVEVLNTDAEGRLVLCDVLWYAQEKYKPAAMVDLATLTGACIIALGHENAAVYANEDDFCKAFLKAADAEGEGAWRMPLGQAYDDMLKSPIADMKNIGGRPGGSITAAQFLKRFVKDDVPWIHLDIAGVAHVKADTVYAPKGATGWGVLSLSRLVSERFETE